MQTTPVTLGADVFRLFPATRYQGSKRKMLPAIHQVSKGYQFDTVLDLFSGSGVVALLYRTMGKTVHANDFLASCAATARLFLNYEHGLEDLDVSRERLLELLAHAPLEEPGLIQQHFDGIYFRENENRQLDRFCQNIHTVDGVQRDLYTYAVAQACLKKRPYNLFHRANLHMRLKDVKRSFGNKKTWETPIIDHAYKCFVELDKFPFPENHGQHTVSNLDAAELDSFNPNVEFVYLDPPYLNKRGQSVDYADFYHFLEGLTDYQQFNHADAQQKHKPIVSKPSPWLKTDTAEQALGDIMDHFDDSIICLNYRSDSSLTHERMAEIMARPGRKVQVLTAGQYQYALSTNKASEELFIVSEPV